MRKNVKDTPLWMQKSTKPYPYRPVKHQSYACKLQKKKKKKKKKKKNPPPPPPPKKKKP